MALHIGLGSLESSRDTFWSRISSILGDTPVLPCLEVISFTSFGNCRTSLFDTGALGLLSPSVREMCIRFDQVDPREEAWFRNVFSSSLSTTPNLEKLSVRVSSCPPVDLNLLSQSHPRLRHLEVDAKIDPGYLTSVASLPGLEHLSIRLWGIFRAPLRFQRLQRLEISAYELDAICALVHYVDAPRLCDFSIRSTHGHSGNLLTDLSQCLNVLISGRFPSFTAFHWNCRQLGDRKYGYDGTRHPGGTLAELMEPLLSLQTLRRLSLDFSGTIVPYSSADFRRMAEAWPGLETLSLTHGSGSGVENDPVQYGDLECFVSFARNCPRLRTLRIPRVKIDPNADTRIAPLDTRHNLRDLNVDTILGPEEPQWDASRLEQVLRGCIEDIFPFAAVHLPISINVWAQYFAKAHNV
uniref:N/A n=1 Tax=Ganoderma boninense TaxID=34458 RepID=A0A5K1K558_9APHY|nr:N/A [Ganoderma boninense]